MARTDKISAKEHQVLQLIADGLGNGKALAEATGRSREGCHQTAASLVRKGWVYREAGPTNYTLTNAGRVALRQAEQVPGWVTGELD